MKEDLNILKECLKYTEDKFSLEFLENQKFETIGKSKKSSDRINSNTPKIIALYRAAKKDFLNNSLISNLSIEFVQVISTLKFGNIELDFFNYIVSELKRPLPKDYYGIVCELNVCQHYKKSGIEIIKISEGTNSMPDFKIEIDNNLVFVECKSIIPESVKLTPRLSTLIDKLMKTLTDDMAVNIILKSKKPDIYEPELVKLVIEAVKNNQEKLYEGDYCNVQLIKPISKSGNDEFVIPNFNPSKNIGDFKVKVIDGKMIGRCVNFFPFYPNDYKSELAKHLRKANKQIGELGKGILHIQFPPMKVNELQLFVSEIGHRIQDYLNKHLLLAVVINIPHLIEMNNIKNEVVPNINLSYFKSSSLLQELVVKKPYWIDCYKVIEQIDEGNIIACEFETYAPLNSFLFIVRNTALDINIKFFIIENQILYESIVKDSCKVKIIKIPENIIIKNNKLALKIGDIESIFINGQKLGTKT